MTSVITRHAQTIDFCYFSALNEQELMKIARDMCHLNWITLIEVNCSQHLFCSNMTKNNTCVTTWYTRSSNEIRFLAISLKSLLK